MDEIIRDEVVRDEVVRDETYVEPTVGAANSLGVRVAHRRFGGLDIPASLAGMLVAIGFAAIIGGIVAAVMDGFGYALSLEGIATEITTVGFVVGMVILFVAFLVGGWAAGRMARYEGLLNGGMVVIWTLILAAIFGGLGAWVGSQYDVFSTLGLPQWFTSAFDSTTAIISGVIAFVVAVVGALLGGWLGERLHRRADATIAAVDSGYAGSVRNRDIYCREVCGTA